MQQIQQRESELTGIPSLKIGYNNIFGYFIEVRNAHKEKVPDTWIRKQTLSNAERYITEELKEYEEKILGAEDRILTLEQEIYNALIAFVSQSLSQLLRDAHAVARVDCFLSFARIARERNYVRPELDDGARIDIEQGRHPVIETLMPVGEKYIPNDIRLDDEEQQIVMITGPNMSGKSALLRQTSSRSITQAARGRRSSSLWRKWARSFRHAGRTSAWWTRFSPVSARRTIFRRASRPSWSKCSNRPAS